MGEQRLDHGTERLQARHSNFWRTFLTCASLRVAPLSSKSPVGGPWDNKRAMQMHGQQVHSAPAAAGWASHIGLTVTHWNAQHHGSMQPGSRGATHPVGLPLPLGGWLSRWGWARGQGGRPDDVDLVIVLVQQARVCKKTQIKDGINW